MLHVALTPNDLPAFKQLILDRKKINEGQMAKGVEAAFNQSSKLLHYMQDYVAHAMEIVCDIESYLPHDKFDWFQKAYADVKSYAYWQNLPDGDILKEGNTEMFLEHIQRLSDSGSNDVRLLKAQDCSSFIRFFGECVENLAKDPRNLPLNVTSDQKSKFAIAKHLNDWRIQYQDKSKYYGLFKKGVTTGQKRRRIKRTTFISILDQSMGLTDRVLQAPANRMEDEIRDWILFDLGQKATPLEFLEMVAVIISEEERTEVNAGDAFALLCEAAVAWKRGKEANQAIGALTGTGISRWLQLSSDTLAKFNVLFGIRYGATVSGTACDTMFFLDAISCNVPVALDPLFYLLPLGGIVAGGHHTTNEVAIPIALNKEGFEYTIGLYSTIMPTTYSHDEFYGKSGDRSEVGHALTSGENSKGNQLVLVYHSPDKVQAGFLWFSKTDDRQLWKSLATVSKKNHDLIGNIQAMPMYPQKGSLIKLGAAAAQGIQLTPITWAAFRNQVNLD